MLRLSESRHRSFCSEASADLQGGYSKALTWASAIRLKRLVYCMYVIFYFISHYIPPEGPWQRWRGFYKYPFPVPDPHYRS